MPGMIILGTRDDASDAAKATYHATVELWTLYSFGVAVTLLRTYARVRGVGFRNLKADDYLIWVAIAFYTAQTALAYSVGNVAHGLANNSMTDAWRAALHLSDPEYQARVIGSKFQVAGWTTYMLLIGSLKLSMLAFYLRLMDGLGRRYRIPVYIGFALVGASMIASVLTIFTSCRPFNHYWQINPAPDIVCQPAISPPFIWVTFAANLATDPYLIFIPIPMLWKSSLKLLKKTAVTAVLSSGVFVLVCATFKSVFLIVSPVDGAQTAEEWGTRETFAAVITTNLPMIFHLFKVWLGVLFGSAFQSSQRTYKSPSGGFRTIGGGDYQSRDRRGPRSSNPVTTNVTFNESEERIVDNVHLEGLKAYAVPGGENPSSNEILVSSQIEIRHEARRSTNSVPIPEHSVHEPW